MLDSSLVGAHQWVATGTRDQFPLVFESDLVIFSKRPVLPACMRGVVGLIVFASVSEDIASAWHISQVS